MTCVLLMYFVGDNIIIGSYDKRLSWFDLSLSVKPYKTLRCVNTLLIYFMHAVHTCTSIGVYFY